MGLKIDRRADEAIKIIVPSDDGDDVLTVTIEELRDRNVKLDVDGPELYRVHRAELYDDETGEVLDDDRTICVSCGTRFRSALASPENPVFCLDCAPR